MGANDALSEPAQDARENKASDPAITKEAETSMNVEYERLMKHINECNQLTLQSTLDYIGLVGGAPVSSSTLDSVREHIQAYIKATYPELKTVQVKVSFDASRDGYSLIVGVEAVEHEMNIIKDDPVLFPNDEANPMNDDTKPGAHNPKGLADMYKIQLRDLMAMQFVGALINEAGVHGERWKSYESLIRVAYEMADIALKVRLEAPQA